MDTTTDRRNFLRAAGASGAFLLTNPLSALAARGAALPGGGYGPLVDKGDLFLPEDFSLRVISRAGDRMDDGNPAPTKYDGMAAFRGRRGETILIRNHENRNRTGEIPVVVPAAVAYDPSATAGCTKVVLDRQARRVREFAILGGTAVNCAGGAMPWGSWVTCEETFSGTAIPHGYVFEMDVDADGAVKAQPITGAGRFSHEAAVWAGNRLYLTEDRGDACLYRFTPDVRTIRRPGQLARGGGVLEALRIAQVDRADTRSAWPVGEAFRVEWVVVDDPDPVSEADGRSTRAQAQASGAAIFSRQEGAWTDRHRVVFDCTDGGAARAGQIWELDVARDRLTLVYESPGAEILDSPDNLCLVPDTGDVLLCEDGDGEQYLRGLTRGGEIFDFARSKTTDSEFCGACFDPAGEVLFVNQQSPGVTYAIRGPWRRARD